MRNISTDDWYLDYILGPPCSHHWTLRPNTGWDRVVREIQQTSLQEDWWVLETVWRDDVLLYLYYNIMLGLLPPIWKLIYISTMLSQYSEREKDSLHIYLLLIKELHQTFQARLFFYSSLNKSRVLTFTCQGNSDISANWSPGLSTKFSRRNTTGIQPQPRYVVVQ